MKTRKNKAGFTLVELMVVAIIVAILAAVAIPLMSGNRNRAMVTEAQSGLSTISTQMRIYKAEKGDYNVGSTDINKLQGINSGDLEGTYFRHGEYEIKSSSPSNYVLKVISVDASSDATGMGVELDHLGNWKDVSTDPNKKWQ